MNSNPNPIENILGSYRRGIERYYGGRTVGKTLNDEETLAALKKAMEGVIGEDEDMNKILSPDEKINRVEYSRFLAGRNLLRTQQRQQLNALFGEIK